MSTIHGDLLWCDGGWPGSCHEHELLTRWGIDQVLDEIEVTTLVDRGFRGLAKARAHWPAPTGDRRTRDQRTTAERADNRCQAGLRALVEQSIGQLATAWSLRRWRGLVYRVRAVFRAAAVLISSAAGSSGYPPEQASRKPSMTCRAWRLTAIDEA